MFTIEKSFFDSKLKELEKTLDEFKLTNVEKQVMSNYYVNLLLYEIFKSRKIEVLTDGLTYVSFSSILGYILLCLSKNKNFQLIFEGNNFTLKSELKSGDFKWIKNF